MGLTRAREPHPPSRPPRANFIGLGSLLEVVRQSLAQRATPHCARTPVTAH